MSLVENIMTTPPKRVPSDMSIRDAAKGMFSERNRALLIMEDGNDVGIITYSNLAILFVMKKIDPGTTPIKEIMESPIFTVDGGKSIAEAGESMLDKGVRHLAVTAEGKIVGMLDIVDILKHQLSVR